MRVVRATKFGGPEVLVPSEAAEPVAGPGQVVVEVSFAPVLFLDTQIRSGLPRPAARRQYVPSRSSPNPPPPS
jgi:NADPH:quinone reductase